MLSTKYYLIIKTGRKMLLKIKLPYIAANVKVPNELSALTELCKLLAPMNAVKCNMKAKPITKMFFMILHLSSD